MVGQQLIRDRSGTDADPWARENELWAAANSPGQSSDGSGSDSASPRETWPDVSGSAPTPSPDGSAGTSGSDSRPSSASPSTPSPDFSAYPAPPGEWVGVLPGGEIADVVGWVIEDRGSPVLRATVRRATGELALLAPDARVVKA